MFFFISNRYLLIILKNLYNLQISVIQWGDGDFGINIGAGEKIKTNHVKTRRFRGLRMTTSAVIT